MDRTGGKLQWGSARVAGRRVHHGVAGGPGGVPVLFLHGWALGAHSYKRALGRLARMGCRVWAPALPGLGGSAPLPARSFDLGELGDWAAAYLDAVGQHEPCVVVGHSFGGAVGAALAHSRPERVDRLVLINAVGSGVWTAGRRARHISERPLWHWALHFTTDTITDAPIPTLRAIAEDAVPNLVHRPLAVWQSAMAARQADVASELAEIRRSGVPVTALASEGDVVVPRASFEALCRMVGVEGRLLPGGHSWLLGRPDAFAEVMAPIVAGAASEATARRRRPHLRAVVG